MDKTDKMDRLLMFMKWGKKVVLAVEIIFGFLFFGSLILTIIQFSWANVIATISILLGFVLSVLLDGLQRIENTFVGKVLNDLSKSDVDTHQTGLFEGYEGILLKSQPKE